MTTKVRISRTDPSRIVVDTPYVMREHVKAVPGNSWNPKAKEWTVPLSWPSCLALKDEYPDIEIEPDLRDWALRVGAIKRWLRSTRLNIAPDGKDSAVDALIAGDEFAWLYPHQKSDALSIYMAGGSFFLMNEVGTGKTAASLAGLRLLEIASSTDQMPNPFPVLIVCPKSMIRTWEREIRQAFPDSWGEDARTIALVDGTPAKVRDALEPGSDFYIVGWELLRRHSRIAAYGSTTIPAGCNVEKGLNTLGVQTIIGDEIHRISAPDTQRSRAFKYLSHRATYRMGLSGTPIGVGAIDLWHILHCLFPVEYPTKGSYIERFLIERWGEWGERIIEGIRDERDDEFRANFEAISRRMTTAILPLPPIVESVRWVELPPKHRKAYKSMKDNLIAEIEGGTLTAMNQLVKAGRLVQLANSFGELHIDDEGKEVFTMTDESPKLDAFMEDVMGGDYDGHQVVVFSASKQLLRHLANRLEGVRTYTVISGDVTGEDRQKAMDTFQAGDAQFCLLTQAGGEGITLTAADVMVRLIRSWSYRTDTQVAARVLRIGSEVHDVITYVDYLVRDTIDEEVVVRLNSRGEDAEEVFRDNELLEMLNKSS